MLRARRISATSRRSQRNPFSKTAGKATGGSRISSRPLCSLPNPVTNLCELLTAEDGVFRRFRDAELDDLLRGNLDRLAGLGTEPHDHRARRPSLQLKLAEAGNHERVLRLTIRQLYKLLHALCGL